MTLARVQVQLATVLAVAFLTSPFSTPVAAAQQPQANPPVEKGATPPAPAQAGTVPVAIAQDARQTREEFEGLLRRLPPAVGRVLRTDPSLMRNQSYLATYPTLAGFLQQHPEVVNNPGYYLENINTSFWSPPTPPDPAAMAVNMWRNMIEATFVFLGVLGVTVGVLWLVRTVLNHRRWLRVYRTQMELQTKMVDRFPTSEELIAYLRSGAATPMMVEPQPSGSWPRVALPGTPVNRVLWSVQAGLVLSALAVGLVFVSNRLAIPEIGEVFYTIGVLLLAMGIGFVLSAAASYVLSQRLGILAPKA
jgi:hypothetical protein